MQLKERERFRKLLALEKWLSRKLIAESWCPSKSGVHPREKEKKSSKVLAQK